MFTDIEGSTRLHQRLGPLFKTLIAEHDGLLGGVIASAGGVVVRSMGDGVFAAFADAVGAVKAAAEIQRLVAAHQWPDRAELKVRIGLHRGDAEVSGADYVALAVHQAARVSAAAHGGQVLATPSAVEGVVLPSATSLRRLDRYQLKDFDDPVELCQLVIDGLPDEFPPVRARPERAHNLPEVLTAMVGRDLEVSELLELVSDRRLVTVVGPGGVGKTRLAVELVATLASRVAGGVWVVLLANLATPTSLAAHLAAALGIKEIADGSPVDAVAGWVGDREVMLVIDNCEHVSAAASDAIADLLGRCASLRVLATSREPLHVPGEAIWRLDPLTLPPPEVPDDPQSLLGYESVQLLVARVAAARPGFVLDRRNAAAVRSICVELDGLPLALELAAARAAHLSLGDLAERLTERFKLLKTDLRGGREAHKTLLATLQWSYELLDDDERAAFRFLSVFAAPFSIAAAEHVAGGRLAGSTDPVDAVGSLVNKSLLGLESSGPEVRYRMLVTVRAFARHQLEAAGELAAAKRLHLDYVVSATSGAPYRPDSLPLSVERVASVDELEEDLRAAFDTAVEVGERDRALVLAARYGRAAFLHSKWEGAIELLTRAIELGDEPTELFGWALYARGLINVVRQTIDTDAVRADATALIALGDSVGSEFHACGWHLLGDLGIISGRPEAAAAAYNAALQTAEDLKQVASLRRGIALAASMQGDVAAAREEYRDAVAVYRDIADNFEVARTQLVLGPLLDLTEGGRILIEAIEASVELSAHAQVCQGLAGLAALAFDGDAHLAAYLYGAAEGYAERHRLSLDSGLIRVLLGEQLPHLRERLTATVDDPSMAAHRAEGKAAAVADAVIRFSEFAQVTGSD